MKTHNITHYQIVKNLLYVDFICRQQQYNRYQVNIRRYSFRMTQGLALCYEKEAKIIAENEENYELG